jgi:SAM-dependent methyltransferase
MNMRGINPYWLGLTPSEIAAGFHRSFVGGLWEEIGRWQLEFLKEQGLAPHHLLLDAGCGALRGGIHLVPYLYDGHYYGFDINASLIEAGRLELANTAITKTPHLLVDDGFNASRFGVRFDIILAQSLFTHLFANSIVRCLVEAS